MKTSLFNKPIEEITFQDIETFFKAKISENVKVDYKKDFPNDLGKYISGFANTIGGILLIGINADKTTNIPTDINGIDIENGLEEKVMSISQATIEPSVIPEVRVCPFKSDSKLLKDDKAVILIRVEESYDTPHMHLKNKDNRIYIRVHNETRPADIRTIDELMTKRKKSEEKLKDLIKEKIAPRRHKGYRLVYIVPDSPIKSIIPLNKETDNLLRENTPIFLTFGNYKPIREGGYFERQSEFSAEVTKEGLICYRENLENHESVGENAGGIMVDRCMIVLIQMISYAKTIYKNIGYNGNIVIGLEIYGTENKFLFSTKDRPLNKDFKTNEKEILIDYLFSFDDFSSYSEPCFLIFQNFLRLFGLVPDEEILKDWIKKTMTTCKINQ